MILDFIFTGLIELIEVIVAVIDGLLGVLPNLPTFVTTGATNLGAFVGWHLSLLGTTGASIAAGLAWCLDLLVVVLPLACVWLLIRKLRAKPEVHL